MGVIGSLPRPNQSNETKIKGRNNPRNEEKNKKRGEWEKHKARKNE
jgi:hypothetical protein